MLLLVKSNWTYPTALINALNENYWFCYCCYFYNKLSFHLANLIFNSLIFYYYRDYQIYSWQKDRWHQSGNYIELRFIWDNQIICSQSQLSRQRVQRVSRGNYPINPKSLLKQRTDCVQMLSWSCLFALRPAYPLSDWQRDNR